MMQIQKLYVYLFRNKNKVNNKTKIKNDRRYKEI